MTSFFTHSKKALSRLLALGVFSLLLSACGGGVVGNANNYVQIDDQSLVNLKEITLRDVSVEREVCLVVFESSVVSDDVKGNTLIGEKTLAPGTAQDISMTLIRDIREHESLFAELREGACGDESGAILTSDIVVAQGAVAAVQFTVSWSTVPTIDVRDQTLSRVGGGVMVNKVISNSSAWLVAHRYDVSKSRNLGAVMGYQLVDTGHSENVIVTLKELTADTDLVFVLYENVVQQAEDEDFDEMEDVVISNSPTVIMTVTPAQ